MDQVFDFPASQNFKQKRVRGRILTLEASKKIIKQNLSVGFSLLQPGDSGLRVLEEVGLVLPL